MDRAVVLDGRALVGPRPCAAAVATASTRPVAAVMSLKHLSRDKTEALRCQRPVPYGDQWVELLRRCSGVLMVQRRTVPCALAARSAADLPTKAGARMVGVLVQRTGAPPRYRPISPNALPGPDT